MFGSARQGYIHTEPQRIIPSLTPWVDSILEGEKKHESNVSPTISIFHFNEAVQQRPEFLKWIPVRHDKALRGGWWMVVVVLCLL